MKFFLITLASLFLCGAADISSKCMYCICEAETNCQINVPCTIAACGPFGISYAYWLDGGALEGDFQTCCRTMECSQRTVIAYMKRWATPWHLGHAPTCEDYCKIHYGGPFGYDTPQANEFWYRCKQFGCTKDSIQVVKDHLD